MAPPRRTYTGRTLALHRLAVTVLALALVVLGLLMIVRTALLGGGSFGFLFGVLFVAAGGARLYLLRGRPGG
jgi:hypothetical protein